MKKNLSLVIAFLVLAMAAVSSAVETPRIVQDLVVNISRYDANIVEPPLHPTDWIALYKTWPSTCKYECNRLRVTFDDNFRGSKKESSGTTWSLYFIQDEPQGLCARVYIVMRSSSLQYIWARVLVASNMEDEVGKNPYEGWAKEALTAMVHPNDPPDGFHVLKYP